MLKTGFNYCRFLFLLSWSSRPCGWSEVLEDPICCIKPHKSGFVKYNVVYQYKF